MEKNGIGNYNSYAYFNRIFVRFFVAIEIRIQYFNVVANIDLRVPQWTIGHKGEVVDTVFNHMLTEVGLIQQFQHRALGSIAGME